MAKKTVKRNTVPPIDLSTSMMFKNNPKVVKPTASKSKTVKPSGVTRKATEDPNYKNLQNKLNARVVYDYEKKKTPEPKKSESKTVTKAPAKTVSQIWKEKTGKDWSEAKKLGLSDGSAASNMALLKKLKSGSLTNSDLSSSKFKEVGTLEPKKATEISTTNNNTTMKKGGSVKKMQKGGPVDAMHNGMRKIMRKVNAPLRKTLKHVRDNGSGYKNPESSKVPEGFTNGKDTTASTKKYQPGGSTPADSSRVYVKQAEKAFSAGNMKKGKKALSDAARQGMKGKAGYDELGKYKYKTGGMVNSNAKVAASKVASGRPVKSAEPKSAAKKATGRVGGISKSPKTASPKMKMGGSMKRK
jgi:hypothetical protein